MAVKWFTKGDLWCVYAGYYNIWSLSRFGSPFKKLIHISFYLVMFNVDSNSLQFWDGKSEGALLDKWKGVMDSLLGRVVDFLIFF
jgi:hypothetical protein